MQTWELREGLVICSKLQRQAWHHLRLRSLYLVMISEGTRPSSTAAFRSAGMADPFQLSSASESPEPPPPPPPPRPLGKTPIQFKITMAAKRNLNCIGAMAIPSDVVSATSTS